MLYYPIMDIEAQLLELVRRTACEAPEDVLEALARAREAEGEPARGTLGTILENCALAKARGVPMCQDTGTLTFFWWVPPGTRQGPLVAAANAAVRAATARGWLRKNTIDALSGASVDDNVAEGIPVHHFEEREGARCPEVWLLLKGGGSENMSRQYSLPDARLGAGRDLASPVTTQAADTAAMLQGSHGDVASRMAADAAANLPLPAMAGHTGSGVSAAGMKADLSGLNLNFDPSRAGLLGAFGLGG